MEPEPDDYDAGLSGDLGTVTDDEWRAAHERLAADLAGQVPAEQIAYTWDPDLGGRELIGPNETEPAPGDGDYDPDRDERFQGGGFRG